jgi:hypothetical protein
MRSRESKVIVRPQVADFRSITRRANRLVTTVNLHVHFEKFPWLIFGQCDFQYHESLKQWLLKAYLPEGVTDPEHDSAYAFRLPLVGLQFSGLWYHQSHFDAWVDPSGADDFRVPKTGYDPLKLADTQTCTDCDEKHLIVPEGHYVPPFDPDLFKMVGGKRVEIVVGFVEEETEGSGT